MKKLKIWIGQKLCDFGLWVYSLGPKDASDERDCEELRQYRQKFEELKS